jgi:GT2 family glycosyltransferase
LARLAAAGTAPEQEHQRSLRELSAASDIDAVCAIALLGSCTTTVLSRNLATRLLLRPGTHCVEILRSRDTKRWHAVLKSVLKRADLDQHYPAFVPDEHVSEGAPNGTASAHAALAQGLLNISKSLASRAGAYPVTLYALKSLLTKLRRDGLASAISSSAFDAPAGIAPDSSQTSLLRIAFAGRGNAPERSPFNLADGLATWRGPAATDQVSAVADAVVSSAKISICVLNYNSSTTTLRLVTALQRLWPDFEGQLLILDNSSEPHDVQLLSQTLATVWQGRVRLLRAEKNMGIGPARNALFEMVQTPWIMSLDNDMIPIGHLGRQLLPMLDERTPFLNIPYEDLDQPGRAGVGKEWSIQATTNGSRIFTTRYLAHVGHPGTHANETYPPAIESNRLSGGASLFLRSAFDAVGRFDPALEIGYEDYEFSFRLVEKGFVVKSPSVPLLVHGHMAPNHAAELSAVSARFDQSRLQSATRTFTSTLVKRFEAMDRRAEAAGPNHIVPRRFDLRHSSSAAFFHPTESRITSIALIESGTLTAESIAAATNSKALSCRVFHFDEFTNFAYALLLLQSCKSIIVHHGLVAEMPPERFQSLGLRWEHPTFAPRIYAIGASVPRSPLYHGGPELVPVNQLAELALVLNAA